MLTCRHLTHKFTLRRCKNIDDTRHCIHQGGIPLESLSYLVTYSVIALEYNHVTLQKGCQSRSFGGPRKVLYAGLFCDGDGLYANRYGGGFIVLFRPTQAGVFFVFCVSNGFHVMSERGWCVNIGSGLLLLHI